MCGTERMIFWPGSTRVMPLCGKSEKDYLWNSAAPYGAG
jgi:hypothetical protein